MVEKIGTFNEFRFDPVHRVLSRAGVETQLAPKTRDLLLTLLQNPNRLLTRRELLDRIWPGVHVTAESLTFQISELRKALGDQANLIRTIPREGYVWEGDGIEEETTTLRSVLTVAPLGADEGRQAETLPAPAPPRRLSPGLLAGAAGGLVALMIAGYWLMHRSREPAWVESFVDDFERPQIGPDYRPVSGRWNVNYGGLRGEGTGEVNIDLVQRFTGNVRVEYDATILRGSDKREIAVFLRKDHELVSDGYYLAAGGDYEVAEIDRNGTEVQVTLCPATDTDRRYRVSAMRLGNRLGLLVDGRELVGYGDPIPLNATDYSILRIGTFDGIIRIDNLHVYREMVPESLDPTVLGDRLFGRGEFDAAQAEYENVVRDQAGKALAGEALFKVGLCLLEKSQFDDAMDALRQTVASNAPDFYKTAARVAIGTALAATGNLDGALNHLADLEKQTTREEDRYQIASKILLLAHPSYAAGRPDRAAESFRLVLEHFSGQPLLAERAALGLARLEADPEKRTRALKEFLRTYGRIGKPRYSGEELLILIEFLRGDVEGALSVAREMEKEFAGINERFSIRGMSEQALILTAVGDHAGAEAIIHRLHQRLEGDPLPERYAAEWRVFDERLAGNDLGAITTLEGEISGPHGTEPNLAFDRSDLAILYCQTGNTKHAGEIWSSLAESPEAGVREIAGLFLGRLPYDDFIGSEMLDPSLKYFYAGEYARLQRRYVDAFGAYAKCLENAYALTPAVCEARQFIIKTGSPDR